MRRAAVEIGTMLAGGLLGACHPAPQSSPTWITCKGQDASSAAQQARLSACANIISDGATGDDLAAAYRLHGETLRQMGQPTPAIQDFTQAIKVKPDDAESYDDRGLAYRDLNQSGPALADFNAAVRVDPDDGTGFDYRSMLEREQGDLPSAIRDADRAIELKPDWADPWAERGYAWLARKRYDLALADFRDALRLDATLTDVDDSAGDAEAAKGDIKAANAAYDHAYSTDLNSKNFTAAIAEANKTLALAPGDPEQLNSRCWARAIADTELDGALADCQQSLTVRPGSAEVLDSLGFVQFRQGHFDQAIASYSAAIAKDPKQTSSLYMRGMSKLRAGDAAGGNADLDAAKNADSNVADQYAGYGVTP